ncbi:sigma 54 modulation/S30EA ribosomal C-terminal domain-containing protein [Nocardia spumae]|uniref:sigma 54 modulation/S30EA ribosomal C-terminal domain-containing protein n=1 Tax=Nocardia spumae TaxID=2887190 RepID=UPI001D15BB6D|nr:sigma 54 modulation/S30EA ribosomal C-terminal domain-containing protein [Nocardia spumae]
MTLGSTVPADPCPGPRDRPGDIPSPIIVPAVDIRTDPRIPAMFAEYARQRIRAAAQRCPFPIRSIRVRLADHHDTAVSHAFVAQADIVTSRMVRIQVTGATAREAVDALQARARARLHTLPAPRPAPWSHCEPQAATLLFLRPVRERKVVRTKCFHLIERTPAEAAVDMTLMDYTFELFRETGAETDSVLYRTGHDGYRLIRLDRRPVAVHTDPRQITVDPRPAPRWDREQALVRLSLSGLPFLFYRDRDLDRGCVLYHRYDGHYGFMTSRR